MKILENHWYGLLFLIMLWVGESYGMPFISGLAVWSIWIFYILILIPALIALPTLDAAMKQASYQKKYKM